MAHTTERAILVLCTNLSLVATVQAITADVEETEENFDSLFYAIELLECFPANVQHAATMRRVIVPRRFAIVASVRAAQIKKYGEGGQAEPVSGLLELLADAPGDILRVIVGFIGEEVEETQEQKVARLERAESRIGGLKREVAGQRRQNEQQREVIEELKGEGTEAGRKRGREE